MITLEIEIIPPDPKSLGVTPKCMFFTLKIHIKQLLYVTFCKMPAEIEASIWIHQRMEGETDMKVEIFI